MLGVGCYGYAEGFFISFLEVAATAAVYVHLDAAGHYVHAFCVDYFCAYYGKVAVGDLKYLVVAYDDAAVFQPPLGGEYATVDDLF